MKKRDLEPCPLKDPLLTEIWKKTHWYKKSWLQFFLGLGGEGKSWSCLTLAEILDPTFTIDRVTFRVKDFILALDSLTSPGQVVVWEEPGVGANARRWYTAANMAASEVTQTTRYINPIVFMPTPLKEISDPQVRSLANAIFVAKRRGFGPAELKVVINEPDFINGKIMHPYPRLRIDDQLVRYQKMIIKKLPSKELREAYEKKAAKFKSEVREKNIKLLDYLEESEYTVRGEDVLNATTEVMENLEEYTTKKGLNWKLIMSQTGLSRDKAQIVKATIEKRLRKKSEKNDEK